MSWQDTVISIGQFAMVSALVPTIRGKAKPPLSTSLLTASVLLSFCVAFATLGLWLSVISSAAATAAWIILAKQKLEQPERKCSECRWCVGLGDNAFGPLGWCVENTREIEQNESDCGSWWREQENG